MPLDPLLKKMINELRDLPLPPSLGVEKARDAAASWTMSLRDQGLRRYTVGRQEDRIISGHCADIPIRIYWPDTHTTPPVMAFIHGGGWVLGDLDVYEDICQSLCSATQSIVVSIGYRLAPEHPFPAAIDDCLLAALWVRDHASELGADPGWIFIAGDSAGGNLATVVAQELMQANENFLIGQILIYPVVDHPAVGRTSYFYVGEDYSLDRDVAGMHWFARLYLGDSGAEKDPRFAPLNATTLAGLPDTFIVTAEYDPLRDEGEDYALRLFDAGVPVSCKRFSGVTHGFFHFQGLVPAADDALSDIAAWMPTCVNRHGSQ